MRDQPVRVDPAGDRAEPAAGHDPMAGVHVVGGAEPDTAGIIPGAERAVKWPGTRPDWTIQPHFLAQLKTHGATSHDLVNDRAALAGRGRPHRRQQRSGSMGVQVLTHIGTDCRM